MTYTFKAGELVRLVPTQGVHQKERAGTVVRVTPTQVSAWSKAGKSISYADQCKSRTVLRRDLPEWADAAKCSSQQGRGSGHTPSNVC